MIGYKAFDENLKSERLMLPVEQKKKKDLKLLNWNNEIFKESNTEVA